VGEGEAEGNLGEKLERWSEGEGESEGEGAGEKGGVEEGEGEAERVGFPSMGQLIQTNFFSKSIVNTFASITFASHK
jgi:hypothetical protein